MISNASSMLVTGCMTAMGNNLALKPVDTHELAELQMYQFSDAARAAAEKAKRRTSQSGDTGSR